MVAKLLTGEASLGLGAWDLIVVDDVLHILKSQGNRPHYSDFIQCSHTLLYYFQKENCCEPELTKCFCFVVQWRVAAPFQRFKNLMV